MSKTKIERKDGAADYDAQNDTLFVHSKNQEYKSSIDLDGIILDIAKDNSIMGIEILDASERFGISRYDTQHYKALEVTFTISERIIDVELTLYIVKRNTKIPHIASASVINSMKLPASSGSLAIVA